MQLAVEEDDTGQRTMLGREARHRFILDWISNRQYADVLDTEFVEAYIAHTGAPATHQLRGAPRCQRLSRDLAELHRRRELTRDSCGISACGPGFPTWVYVYTTPRDEKR